MARRIHETGARALAASLVLAAGSLAPAASPSTPSGSASLSLDRDLYGPGEVATLTMTGEPGHIPALLIASHPGPSTIPGVGELDVAIVPFPEVVVLPPYGSSGSRAVTCSFDCESPILRLPCFLQVVNIDPTTGQPSGITNLEVLTVVNGDCGACPEAAVVDPDCGSGTYHALTFPGIGTDYAFVTGASFVEQPNGTGSLSGIVARLSDPGARFFVAVDFEDRVDPGDVGYPPVGSPKLELCDEAYIADGGPLHTGLWHYYETFSGHLVGLGDHDGALLSIERKGPPLQVGYGANGKNLEYGASSWLEVEVLAHPDAGAFPSPPSGGDINIGLDGECVDCPAPAEPDGDYAVFGGGHALWIPGVGKDFVFEGDGRFVEYADGTARLTGTAVRAADDDSRFEVDVLFAGRMDPGSADYPPADSPKLELDSAAYVSDGGPVDPSLWRYYLVTDGFLYGEGDLDGAVYRLERRGPAFQVGPGASGKNTAFGASGWLGLELLSPASSGDSLPSEAEGDFNMDLGECP